MKITKLIRKPLNLIGLDIKKFRPEIDYLKFLERYGIKTVLDIGANTGQFAKEIRGKLPQAKIYSYEPIKESFNKLNENMAKDKNFKSFNFALGNKNEHLEMNKSDYTPSSSILKMSGIHKTLFPHTKENQPERIEVKKLDDIASSLSFENEILIKADVQGFEDKVIEGGKETFKRAKILLIETSFVELYENQPLFADIYEKLKNLCFTYKGSISQKINKKGEVVFEDSLFLRN